MGKLDPRIKKWLVWGAGGAIALALILTIVGFAYVGVITRQIDQRIEQLHLAKGTQFFALYPPLQVNQRFSKSELRSYLEDQGYSEARNPEDVRAGEYAWNKEGVSLFRLNFDGAGHQVDRLRARLKLEQQGDEWTIREIAAQDGGTLETFEGRPKRIGAFVAGRLRTQSSITFSEIPVSMRHAVMAIEDVHFLEHSGVSLRSTIRALWKDLKARKWVEGGSTITQQLMKNLFFSREKALSRKIKEAIFAFVTEWRHSKEAILEAYLNEVYLGQWSTHEIHGVSEGARYYFNRPASELSLHQSATLAAIIQAPNVHDPRRFPDRALKRRNIVIKQMAAAGFIDLDEAELAIREPLGVVPSDRSLDDSDYFMDLVMQRLPADVRSQLDARSLAIYTTLNPFLQANASRLIKTNLDRLQKLSPGIRNREKRGIHLQAALLAVNVKDCSVLALQGGKSYRQTQFNRVLQGKRQPGSLFKPFVFLAAFDKLRDKPVTPMTEIEDSPFEWKYEGQVWKPRNYDNEFRQKVTARQTLEMSLNIPTARMAALVGLDPILSTLSAAGIKSPLPTVPSISLGSAEVTPIELAEAYLTLANVGRACELRPFFEVFDENKNMLAQNSMQTRDALPAGPSYLTISMLKGVFTQGTARSALASGLPLENFAGKTGTTNDAKDAWFVGFSPNLLVLIWVGYDEEEKMGLSGAVAALPLWVDFVKAMRPFLSPEDFVVPEGVVAMNIDPESKQLSTASCPTKITEHFLKGTEPQSTCPLHP